MVKSRLCFCVFCVLRVMVALKGVLAHVGANEKYKGGILKYVPCILKYVRPFFGGSFGGVLNADKRVASARLLMSVPV